MQETRSDPSVTPRHRQPDHVVERQLKTFVPHPLRTVTEVRPRSADVAIEQCTPEADAHVCSDLRPVSGDPADEPKRGFSLAQACQRHGDTLHFEADLDVIVEDDREPETLAIELQALGEVLFDERAVGQVMKRRVLAPGVGMDPAILQDLGRAGARLVDAVESNGKLADGDDGAVDAVDVSGRALHDACILERCMRALVFAGDEVGPAGALERQPDLPFVTNLAPDLERLAPCVSGCRGSHPARRATPRSRNARARVNDARAQRLLPRAPS